MNRSEALHHIATQAAHGDLVFPTNVSASLKIHHMLDDPACDLETASMLISGEPLLAARAVAIANSVAFSRLGGNVTNVKTAVSMLGFNALRGIVAALVVRQVSGLITDPLIRAKATRLWEHSAHVAALAHVIARRVSKIEPETALFAGIVHDVGGFYLLSRAGQYPALMEKPAVTVVGDDLSDQTREIVIGRAVLKKLMVPKAVLAAIEAMWQGTPVLPPKTLADTLMIANDLAHTISPLDKRPFATIQKQTSDFDFSVGNSTFTSVMAESEEEVQSLIDALIS